MANTPSFLEYLPKGSMMNETQSGRPLDIESPYAKALTVYLLMPEAQDPLDAISNDAFPDHLDSLEAVEGSEWVLCIRNKQGKRPDWTKFFTTLIDLGKFGSNSSVSALLLVPYGGRVWALTFGRGRSMLKEGVIEDRFGLQTALNAIDSEKVRAIDKETFDSFAAQARQQATADTEFGHFGVDVDRDLLYAVAGVPRDVRLGRRLAGKDALCASVKVAVTDLPGYLGLLLDTYNSKAYKNDKRFAWIDNIYEIREKTKRRELDALLLEKLRRGQTAKAWLALPEIINWQRANNFSYANPTPNFTVDDIHLKTFLDSYGSRLGAIDVITLKRAKVICFDHDNEELHRWSVYRCLYAEIEVAGDVFLLTNAHWYKLNREIVTEISRWFNELVVDNSLMPPMIAGEWEDDYNRRLGFGGYYHLFHGNSVYLPANSGIEFCDLAKFSEHSCDLIHVKRYGRSNKLSHLFYQGLNSAKLFRTSPEFRKALSQSIKNDADVSTELLEEPPRGKYRIVYAIASSSTSKLDLPLFSKLSLRQALRELEGLGFRTSVAKISVPAEERIVKHIKGIRKTF